MRQASTKSSTLLAEGAAAARALNRAPTAFHRHRGVGSQSEWVTRRRAEGRARTIMNIGLPDWPATREALGWLWARFEEEGLDPPDAYQLILERRMGLPAAIRARMPAETGPVLCGQADWFEAAACVPIQPQAPLIGPPASFENALLALAAGLDTLGNLCAFVLRYPYWDDAQAQIESVLRALGACAALRDEGVVVDSYLEDGHSGMFADLRSIVGWSLVERHIVERLCGARYAVAFGGLTADPFTRAAAFRAIERCGSPGVVSHGYLHGGTLSHVESEVRNLALFAHDTSVSLAANHHFGWGSAYVAVPLTERERVPTPEEILEVHRLARALEPHAHSLADRIDWSGVEQRAEVLAASGQRWWQRLRTHLAERGVDLDDPMDLMLSLRASTPLEIERIGLGGEADDDAQPTDLAAAMISARESACKQVADCSRCDGMRALVASTDIHYYAKAVLEGVLEARGAEVVDGGLAADPETLIDRAIASGSAAVVVTTHNGWALNFGQRLVRERDRRGVGLLLVMGGVLNEDAGPGSNSSVPREVSRDLNALGITTTNDFAVLVELLAARIP